MSFDVNIDLELSLNSINWIASARIWLVWAKLLAKPESTHLENPPLILFLVSKNTLIYIHLLTPITSPKKKLHITVARTTG